MSKKGQFLQVFLFSNSTSAWRRVRNVFVFVALLMVVMTSGCRRRAQLVEPVAAKPEVITNRMADATYVRALKENQVWQRQKAQERNKIVAQMQVLLEKAKATLPADANNEALKAELAKDPAWRALEAENQRLVDELQQVLTRARETIHQRLLTEQRDVQAVAEGRAVAVDPPKPNIADGKLQK